MEFSCVWLMLWAALKNYFYCFNIRPVFVYTIDERKHHRNMYTVFIANGIQQLFDIQMKNSNSVKFEPIFLIE